MKNANNYQKDVCLHTPSGKATMLGRSFDLVIRKNTLICKDTDMALCAYCEKRIKPPKQYYSRQRLLAYASVSLLIGLLYGLLATALGNAQPYHEDLWAVGGLGAFLITTRLIEHIFCAALLASWQWEVVDIDSPDWPPRTTEHDAHIFDTRRVYCRDERALRRIVLLVGGLLYAFLITIY